MTKRRYQFSPAISFVNEALETRVVLSASPASATAHVAAAKHVATRTTLSVTSGTLAQPIVFNVVVKGNARAGAPQGNVNIVDHGQVVATVPVTASTGGKSIATYTLPYGAGGQDVFFGKYKVTAQFVPSAGFAKSSASKAFTIGVPKFTTLANGVDVATVAQGSGAAIQSGQTASVRYTGYLASTGQVFDMSNSHGGAPFSFQLGASQVIPGFDEGIQGMTVGETRIISIPAAQGYGSTATGSIPANSDLLFVVSLDAIS